MANILEAVLRPSKAITPSGTKISKDKSKELKKARKALFLVAPKLDLWKVRNQSR
jgi:hypothetical protein